MYELMRKLGEFVIILTNVYGLTAYILQHVLGHLSLII